MNKIFVVISILTLSVIYPADYYISSSGSDNNPGTLSNPWKTVNKVNSINFKAGDRIYFRGGQTFTGGLVFRSTDTGTEASPILVSSYGTGRALISSGYSKGFDAYNTSGIRINNINFQGSGRTVNAEHGICFNMNIANTKLPYVRIENVNVSGYGVHGILIGSWSGTSGFRNVDIINAVVHDTKVSGITVYGYFKLSSEGIWCHKDVYIKGCKVYDISGDPAMTQHSGSGIVISQVDGAVMEYCEVYNTGFLCKANSGGPVGLWAWDCNNVIIQYNESHHNKTANSFDGGGFDLDGGCWSSVMQYNYSHDNYGAGYLLCQFSGSRSMRNNTVRYNISENDGRRNSYPAIYIYGTQSNTKIYNNTIYLSPASVGSPAIVKISGGTDTVVANNILQTAGGLKLIDYNYGSVSFNGNCYYSTGSAFRIDWKGAIYSTLSAWRLATGEEKLSGNNTGLSVNPLLQSPGNGGTIGDPQNLGSLSAYKLKSTSQLINKGLDLSVSFSINQGTRDFYGNSIPGSGNYDIGAHDGGTASTPTPTKTPTMKPTSTSSPLPTNTPIPTGTGGNLLENPGFEGGMVGWEWWRNAGVANDNAHSGTKALKIGCDGGYHNTIQEVPVIAGKTYIVSGYHKVINRTGGYSRILYVWKNTSGVIGYAKSLGSTSSANYIFSSAEITAPSGAIQCRIYCGSHGTGGDAYLDDISLSEKGGSVPTATPTLIATSTSAPTPTPVPTVTPPASSENLLINPGFENGETGWEWWKNGAIVSSPVHSGSKAAMITLGSGYLNVIQEIAVEGGKTYTVLAWVKPEGITSGYGRIIYRWYAGSTQLTTTYLDPVKGTSDWKKVSTQVVAPNNATIARFFIGVIPGTGRAYYDDAVFGSEGGGIPTSTPIPVPTVTPTSSSENLLVNPGFEQGEAGWSWWQNGIVVSSPVHSGSKALRIPMTSSYPTIIQEIAVDSGTAYTFSGWLSVSQGSTGMGRIIYCWLAGGSRVGSWYTIDFVTAAGWTYMIGTGTALTGATHVRFICGATPGFGSAYYDDTSLKRGSGSAVSMIQEIDHDEMREENDHAADKKLYSLSADSRITFLFGMEKDLSHLQVDISTVNGTLVKRIYGKSALSMDLNEDCFKNGIYVYSICDRNTGIVINKGVFVLIP
ncbi:carbohydrate binding domain-containing protein [Spirochaetota bacterium]